MKIVLASVLKPVDDSRVFEKIGLSLSKIQNAEIHIVGTASLNKTAPIQNITFHPYDEISKKPTRLTTSRLFLSQIRKVKPDLIIVHTIELLPALIYYKIKNKKVKIIYDMLENYPFNFRYQKYRPTLQSQILSSFSHLIEKVSYPFLSHIFVAEQTYLTEKKLPLSKTTILENKFNPIYHLKKSIKKQSNTVSLVFCGSLTKIFGVEVILNWFSDLSSCKSVLNYKLTIIGKAYEEDVIQILQNSTTTNKNIKCIGVTEFVPHEQIIKEMFSSDFVVLPYPENPCTKNCIPTKLYECLGLGIPMLTQENLLWEKVCKESNGSMFIDFKQPIEIKSFEEQINTFIPYSNGIDQKALWNTEEKKLLNIIETL
ncbi:hypothetical protein EI427_06975 [Flammeovirga pectinis]|uniref:Glycosyltransferase n=1 Tax=Flammeovirga pectinis TaxID=2494373 RepID=A0A3S9P1C7_9BACT|nr:hypothetical protein [Flammeovirga pectinis]AZQ61989.1 hypothetical protein EI427_06975 [Flammeovirga pectinis]